MKKDYIFFPNLNGLRCIAAFMVIFHHIEQIKGRFGIATGYKDNIYGVTLGSLGVTLFFCLSGFLITYLLLAERRETGTIGVRNFYVRRVLRIWPLYFLIIFSAFAVLNRIDFYLLPDLHEAAKKDYWSLLFYYLTFTPNFAVFAVMPYASQCWSIGVEEQFYAVWPLVIRFVKKSILLIGVIVAVFIVLNLFVDLFLIKVASRKVYYVARVLLTVCRFDCMAVGAVFAHLLFQHRDGRLIAFFYRNDVQALTYAAATYLLIKLPIFHGLGHLPYAVVFSVLILNMAANPATLVSLENPLLDYLGKISYGLYMFHPVVVVTGIKVCYASMALLGLSTLTHFNMLLYPFVISVTIGVAALSYHLLEKKFLLLKGSFSALISGDTARESLMPRRVPRQSPEPEQCPE
jgi:peptidoglycan/LPS O-acetylase OafA/YrhL